MAEDDDLALLKQRYVQGKITRKKYLEMKADLEEGTAAEAAKPFAAKQSHQAASSTGARLATFFFIIFFAACLYLFVMPYLSNNVFQSPQAGSSSNPYSADQGFVGTGYYDIGGQSTYVSNQSRLTEASAAAQQAAPLTPTGNPITLYPTYLQVHNYYASQIVKYAAVDLSTNQTFNTTYAIAANNGADTVTLLIPGNDAYKLTIYAATNGDSVWWNKIYLNTGGTVIVYLRGGALAGPRTPENLCANDPMSQGDEAYSTAAGIECDGSTPPYPSS